jgi:phosphotriesterase-related protein
VIRDITVGVDNTGIRAGIIGEIGCSTPLEERERKVLRCCAAAQRQTGVTIYIHPGHSEDTAWEITRILSEAGADLSRVIIGHVDLFNYNTETCHKLMDAGCYIAYDNFGHEGFFQVPHVTRYFETSDIGRINDIIKLVKGGYLNQILISQDVATKERLASYGGTGYAHISRDIVPVMSIKGLSDEQIHTLLVENPKRIISFAPAKN